MIDHRMQNAALFIRMVRHIVISLRMNREAAQQRIAMVSVVIHRIHAIGGMMRISGQEFMLCLLWPQCMTTGMQIMLPLYFL